MKVLLKHFGSVSTVLALYERSELAYILQLVSLMQEQVKPIVVRTVHLVRMMKATVTFVALTCWWSLELTLKGRRMRTEMRRRITRDKRTRNITWGLVRDYGVITRTGTERVGNLIFRRRWLLLTQFLLGLLMFFEVATFVQFIGEFAHVFIRLDSGVAVDDYRLSIAFDDLFASHSVWMNRNL